jgi:hypothetical protein
MFSVAGSPFSVVNLLDRAIEALARVDVASLTDVLSDCSRAEIAVSPEEFSRALTQQAALEKVLEQTQRNIRLLRDEEVGFRYGHSRGRSS